MTLINRPWGSISIPKEQWILKGLNDSAFKGQHCILVTQQMIQLSANQSAVDTLQNYSLEVLADIISQRTSASCYSIQFSFNMISAPAIGYYYITDFLCFIAVQVSGTIAVNGQNILNALSGTMLSGFTTDYWKNSAYIAGTIDTTPTPIYYCPIDGQQFSSQAELDIHYAIAHPSEPPPRKLPTEVEDFKKWLDRSVAFEKYTDPAGTPFQAAQITYRGVPVGMQDEDRFTPMNTPAFLPFAQETSDPYNALLLAIIALYLRNPQNRESLLKFADKYTTNVTKILNTIIETGKTHPITALNANTTFAVVAHRFGIITDSGYLKIVDQTRAIIDKLIQKEFAGIALEGLSTFTDKATSIIKSGR